ncbi:MAG: HvfC family RiPP maturation protein [Shewanella sp.]
MDVKQIQQSFIDYIRDPSQPLPPNTTGARMRIYRELFFNNVLGFVSNGFPVLRSLYSETHWQTLVDDFFRRHECQSPIFLDIAGEFIQFLQHEYQPRASDPPFMLALAHYEWLELVVACAQDAADEAVIAPHAIGEAALCLATSARLAQYAYPVQRISRDFHPESPLATPVYFCLYQDEAGEVIFLQLTPLSAQLLAYLAEEGPLTVMQLMHWLTETYPQVAAEVLHHGGVQLLAQLAEKGIVRQCRSAPENAC